MRRLLAALLPVCLLFAASACDKGTGGDAKSAPGGSAAGGAAKPPLKIAYSDWPGWVAWDVAAKKGWFKEAGVDVELVWLDYAKSMEAYTGGQADAVCMTNGDAMATGATGKPSTAVVLNDYSDGNDMIVAKPGIDSVKDLKGKKVGVEVGFVDHLLLLKALEANGLTEKDVTVVNMKTDSAPQALAASKDGVDAIAAWQPNSGAALKQVAGSKAIFTSKDVPGLIYDGLYVSRESLGARADDWQKVVGVWFKVVAYVADPATRPEAAKLMAARAGGLPPEDYLKLMDGTHFLDLPANLKAFEKGDTLASVYGSGGIVDKFSVEKGVYPKAQDVASYLDPRMVMAAKK